MDKLLIEHRLHRPPDHRYDLPVGATVIVDEAGMIPTARLAELADLADVRGWRIALVGDPLQFSAVGRGGMFGLLVDTFDAVELDRVHRFHQPLGTRRQPRPSATATSTSPTSTTNTAGCTAAPATPWNALRWQPGGLTATPVRPSR